MKVVIVASSNFSDKSQFLEKVDLNKYNEIIVKSKTNIATWVKELGYTPTEFDKYKEFDIPTDAEIIAFWDGESLNVKNIVDAHPEATVYSFENTTTKSFYDEIEKISNEKWKLGCKELAKKLPNYFWVVAASSSGKYHPQCDLGNGGLVRHSVLVCEFAIDFVTSEIFVEDNNINKDMAIVAALFHDCLKQGNDCNGHTVFDHPLLAAEFLAKELKDYIEEPYLSTICGAVRTHMGKWTTSTYAPDITLEKPSTSFQKLVHSADYAASRKYVGGLECWKN